MIARSATAQDVYTGDGTTTVVLLIGELLSQAQRMLAEGVHPRVMQRGFELAKEATLSYLEEAKVSLGDVDEVGSAAVRDKLVDVARTSLNTKMEADMAAKLTDIVVDAIGCIRQPGTNDIDLHMVEIIHMINRKASDSRLVRGLVLDHGARHPDMPKR